MSSAEVITLNAKMDRVLSILENDHRTGEKGLVNEVNDLKLEFHSFREQYNNDQAIKKTKETIWKIIWGAVGAFLLAAGKFLLTLFLKFFNI